MNERQKAAKYLLYSNRMAKFNLIIAYWKEFERRKFEANPPKIGRTFEDEWPLRLTNRLIDSTIEVSRAFRRRSSWHED